MLTAATPPAPSQHSVLGCGSTAYETFQNCPRLTDRALGLCGSRRCLKRAEVDEMDDDSGHAVRDRWASDMSTLIAKTDEEMPSMAPVCDWDQPESEVFEKNLGPDGEVVGTDIGSSGTMAIPVVVGLVGIAYYYFFVLKKSEEEN